MDDKRRRDTDPGSRSNRENTQSSNLSNRYLHVAALVNVLRPNTNNGELETQTSRKNLVEADGVTHNGRQEPPGQRAKYIMFGDYWLESYRQSTFKEWCYDYPVHPVKLAAVGFCYTGFKDRVKCFSCGLSVENWTMSDDPTDRRWHKTDCKMANDTDDRNVPLYSTVLRKMFRDFLSKSQTTTPGFTLPTTCGTEHRSKNLPGSSSGFLTAESAQVISNRAVRPLKASRPEAVQRPQEQPFRLAPIYSAEHEILLLGLNMSLESDRRKTFAKWPVYPAPLLPGKLAKCGLFYLGNLDRTQCFSCCGILRNWSASDDPISQHGRLFPNCRMVTRSDARNVPMTSSERLTLYDEDVRRNNILVSTAPVEPPDPPAHEQMLLARFFPCLNPANPHMINERDRVASFANGWPSHKTRVTPIEIAKAGFFFLGQEDRTKCFHCNGGLQHWALNDEPWTEHAKWFPGCAFVLRQKGIEFVRRLKEANPNLNRPAIKNAVSYDIPEFSMPQQIDIASGGLPAVSQDNMRAEEALAELQRQNLCKKCLRHNADQLCLPCSHIALCSFCKSDKCPVCETKVSSCLKIYRN